VNDDKQQQLVIDLKTAEAVVNYLATRPYIEVFQLIAAMQQLKPLPEPAAPTVNEAGIPLG